MVSLMWICVFAAGKAYAVTLVKAAPLEKNIVVLDESDPLPLAALKISDVAFLATGKTASTYMEALQELKQKAIAANANIIKITGQQFGTDDECRKLSAILYKAGEPKQYEKEFSWSKERKLSWADFIGRSSAGTEDEQAVAATNCGFQFATNMVSNSGQVKVMVYNSFRKHTSWALPAERTGEVLEHEQGHFDLCEVYTRKLRQKIEHMDLNATNFVTLLTNAYTEVRDAYLQQQQAYEEETHHGQNTGLQKEWERVIEKDLSSTEPWMM